MKLTDTNRLDIIHQWLRNLNIIYKDSGREQTILQEIVNKIEELRNKEEI